ncbi:MAG: UDP-glucose--sterol glucosyltransferase [Flavobacteriaceae bacterium]|nr:MAG: UDP-glucose--sterol glucosyltransferase [Flavobacteriaceae bacterium]
MKAILFSIGTRGDIEPFLAIAQLLKEKHWEVICVFPEQFRETVEAMDLSFRGFNKEFLELMDGKEAKMVMGGYGSIFKRVLMMAKMSKGALKLTKEMLILQHELQQKENPDKIIYHPKCNYSLLWGMVNPGKTIMFSPIPGVAHPINHLTILGGNYGRILNKLSFWIANSLKAAVLLKISKRFSNDYKAIKLTTSSIKSAMLVSEKSCYAISPSLFPKPSYWPSNAHIVGFYELNKMKNWEPSTALKQFVNKNPKIIFITFGSMSNDNPTEKTNIILKVLKRHNISAIINTSLGGLENTGEPSDNILFVNNIPYDWIFPKVYAVVHHGGSGTTHTALKYGCPNLIIPHILDQPFWNSTIASLELGPLGMPIKDLNKKDFRSLLLDLIRNKIYKKNALRIRVAMQHESNEDSLYELIKS